MARTMWCAGAAAALAVVLTACTSSSGGSAPTTPPLGTTAPSSSPGSITGTAPTAPTSAQPSSPTSSAPSSSTSSQPVAGSTISCTPTVSEFSVGGQDGASMHVVFVVTARNASQQTCLTQGYPGVALLDARGRQIEQATRRPFGYMGGLLKGAPPLITLRPGQQASARIEGVTINETTQRSCPQATGILFTLPDNRDSTKLTVGFPACAGVEVHPMLPGTTGSR